MKLPFVIEAATTRKDKSMGAQHVIHIDEESKRVKPQLAVELDILKLTAVKLEHGKSITFGERNIVWSATARHS